MATLTDQILRWLLDASATACALLALVSFALLVVRRPVWRRRLATTGLLGSILIAGIHIMPATAHWSLHWYDIQQPRVLPWLDDTIKPRSTMAAAADAALAPPRQVVARRSWLDAASYSLHQYAPPALTTAYVVVAVALALRLAVGWLWLWYLAARALAPGASLNEIVRKLSRNRAPRVRLSPHLDRPLVFGLWRPTILLPAALVQAVDESELQAILAHEVAHYRGGDLLRTWLAAPCLILFYPLPPLWWVLRALRLSQEQLADQAAAALHHGSLAYAELLARLARQNSRNHDGLALAAWRSPSETLLRIRALLQRPPRRATRRAKIGIAVAAASILLASTALGMLTLNDTGPAARLRAAELHGVRYLLDQQESNGGWISAAGPAPTALVARALLQAGVPVDHPAIVRGRAFLDARQQPDGGFYTDVLPSYETAVVLSLYVAFDDHDAQRRLAQGRAFLQRAALETPAAGPWYQSNQTTLHDNIGQSSRALGTTDTERGSDDVLNTYGNLSYANWKSLAYAQLTRTDPRVLQARRWLDNYWTVDRHPGTNGPDGHFYFLMAASRTLSVAGDASSAGSATSHWRAELQNWLLAAQDHDGSWINRQSTGWMENRPQLVTAYALLALQASR